MKHILIAGYYGFGNTGDEAILAGILKGLRESIPDLSVTVLSGRPGETSETHRVDAVSWQDVVGIERSVQEADGVIIGGGGLFHDYWGLDPNLLLTSNHYGIVYYAGIALLSSLYGKPLVMYAVGVGPLLFDEGRRLTKAAFSLADAVTVRDFRSGETLKELGFKGELLQVTSDPAIAIDVADKKRALEILEKEALPGTGPLIGVSIRNWDREVSPEYWEKQIAEALDRLLSKEGGYALFIPFQRLDGTLEDDTAAAERIAQMMSCSSQAKILRGAYLPGEIAGIIARCDVVLGMRYHSVLFSLLGGVPVVALGYDQKVLNLMSEMGCAGFLIDMKEVGVEKITGVLTEALRHPEKITARFGEVALKMKKSNELNVGMIEGIILGSKSPSRVRDLEDLWPLLGHLVHGHALMSNMKTERNQAFAERDRVIMQLGETSHELDRTRAQLDRATAELNGLKGTLRQIYNSKTWRLGQAVGGKIYGTKIGNLLEQVVGTLLRSGRDGGDGRVKGKDASLNLSVNAAAKGQSLPAEAPPGALSGNRYDIFFFPMIDFSFRYQRPQQLAAHFANKGHRVFYMNVTRFLPMDSAEDFRVEKIRGNLFEVFLKSPAVPDIYGGTLEENVFGSLLDSLKALRKEWGLITVASLVHNPFWAPLVFRMREDRNWKVLYDCLDEWDTFGGIGKYVLEQETLLAKKSDVLTVTAGVLYNKWKGHNPSCEIVRNACDYEHFRGASPGGLPAGVGKPVIGFFGGIADWIDIEMIRHAASARRDWSFVLLGGIFTDVSSVDKLPNVYLPGNQPYSDMPGYLANFEVCLIPFKKNKITEAVDPVKLYEYFSLGKPVVARDLAEMRHYKDYLYLFNTKEEFVECIDRALREDDKGIKEKRREIAATNTWDQRIGVLDKKITSTFPKASIIVVTYNNLDLNKLCLESIFAKTEYPDFEVIVIDNDSKDGTKDYLRAAEKEYASLRVVLNDENRGFARANNQGINMARGAHMVLLNNDTVVTKGWLTRLVSYLDRHPEIGLLGPVTNFCGNEAKIEVDYDGLEGMDSFAYRYTSAHEGVHFDIRMLALYCAAMRREIIEKVGLLDEGFGLGMFEDDDYSHRVKLKGYRVVCAEDIFIHHFGQGAFKKLIETGEYDGLFERNKRIFEEKWGTTWQVHRPR